MDVPTQRPKDSKAGPFREQRVVVGVDGSPGARLALAWALSAAARRRAELVAVSAFPVEVYWLDPHFADLRRVEAIREDTEARGRDLVQEVLRDPAVSSVAGTAEVPVHVLALPGPAAPVLTEHAATADLLVVGSRGRGGIRSTVLGSVALHCAAHAACPVVVVHPGGEEAATGPSAAPRVVVGLDDSPHAKAVLLTAVDEARRRGARVDAVLAYRLPDYWSEAYAGMTPSPEETRARALEHARALVADALGAEAEAVEVTVAEGRAGEVLVQQAAGADLLVVGSRSRSTLPGMVLGSVALHSVVHAPCPVMVVRPVPEAARNRPAVAPEPVTLG